MAWTLRYASHLGYRAPDTPLFRHIVGSLDPVAHVEFAASLGFSGVQYAMAKMRPAVEQDAVARALARHDLESGCMIYTTRDKLAAPLWSRSDAEARAVLAAELAGAFETAKRINSRHVAVLSGVDPRLPLAYQQAAMTENLRWAADLADRAGVILCVESINRRSLPNMLVHHIGDAYEIVRAVDHSSVQLIFDTAHIQAMDGDVLSHLEACWDAIALVQIADNPGRLEPGSGELNFANILRFLYRRQYRGLVELEHDWSLPGRNIEQRGIEFLRKLDAGMTQQREDHEAEG
jgi:hydroxypyruvate isomerase